MNMDYRLSVPTKFGSQRRDLHDGIAMNMIPTAIEAVLHEHLHINDNKSYFQIRDPLGSARQ